MTNDDTIRDQAIEAASHELYESETGLDWYADANPVDTHYSRKRVTPLVDAVLAVVGPAYRAAALRDAAERFATGEWQDAFMAGHVEDDVSAVRATETWFLDRADAELFSEAGS